MQRNFEKTGKSRKKYAHRQIFEGFQDLKTAHRGAGGGVCGQISVNGREVKPAYRVKVGDEVELAFASGTLKFRVLALKETVKKDEASSLYEVIV